MKQIYVANCIEDGEKFVSYFQTNETDKEKLRELGQTLAMGWGAECISVKKYKVPVWKRGRLYDIKEKKWIENSERAVKAFINANSNSTRYDFSKAEYFTIPKEKAPKEVWDCDLSDEENMKDFKPKENK